MTFSLSRRRPVAKGRDAFPAPFSGEWVLGAAPWAEPAPQSVAPLEVVVPGGWIVRGQEIAAVAELVRALRS